MACPSGNNCCPPIPPPFTCQPMGFGNLGCPDPPSHDCSGGSRSRKQGTKEKRWPQCNFLKPCIDLRIYRREEWINEYYTGHIPRDFYRPRCPDCSRSQY